MALDALSRDSVVVVHNEGTTVKDLGPNPTYQGVRVEELNGFIEFQTNAPADATTGAVKGKILLVPGTTASDGAIYVGGMNGATPTWKKIDLSQF